MLTPWKESCNQPKLLVSVVSDSVQPHRWQPTRLPYPWDSPGKNTAVGCHPLDSRKSTLSIHWKDWCWSSNTWPPDAKSWLFGKDPEAGKDWGQEEKGATEDEMVGWHHQLNGHKFEQTPGEVKDREAWRAVVLGVVKSRTRLSNWTTKRHINHLAQ